MDAGAGASPPNRADAAASRSAASSPGVTSAACARPPQITKPILRALSAPLFYYRKPDGLPLMTETQAGRLVAVKRWFCWLARENHILFNPASEIELPRKTRPLPRAILSIQEVESMLALAAVG